MFLLEGNIGAGKSTFLQLIQKHIPSAMVSFEPLSKWEQPINNQSLLKAFYEDPHRWAYTFETFTTACRVMAHREDQNTQQNSPLIVERSMYSGYYCFALNGYKHGFMNDMEWQLYTTWFSFLAQECKAPKGFIYLQTNPTVAFTRLKKRNRSAEATIPLDYLKQIHEHHELFLIHKQNILPELCNTPVLVIPCDQDFENSSEQSTAHLQRVQEFIKKYV